MLLCFHYYLWNKKQFDDKVFCLQMEEQRKMGEEEEEEEKEEEEEEEEKEEKESSQYWFKSESMLRIHVLCTR